MSYAFAIGRSWQFSSTVWYLAKLLYFTNPDFPEIFGDFPYFSPPFGVKTRVFGRELI